jgi:hypothetical protein
MSKRKSAAKKGRALVVVRGAEAAAVAATEESAVSVGSRAEWAG